MPPVELVTGAGAIPREWQATVLAGRGRPSGTACKIANSCGEKKRRDELGYRQARANKSLPRGATCEA